MYILERKGDIYVEMKMGYDGVDIIKNISLSIRSREIYCNRA